MKWLTRLGLSAFTFVLGGLVVGLGGQAQAQQIPAPDLYDGASDCTTAVPTVLRGAFPGAMSTLDTALTGFGPIDLTAGMNGNLVGVVSAPAACDSNAVASQFDAAKRLYDDAAAAKTLASGEDPDPLAVADYATKKAARDDFGGAVYEALYAQYDREAAARKAISDYNLVVSTTSGSEGSFTVAKTQYDEINITATGNVNLDAYDGTSDPVVPGDYGGRGSVAGFRDVGGSGVFASVAAAVETDGELSAAFMTALETTFTTGGTLQLATDTSGPTPVATVSTDVTTLGGISTYLTNWNSIVDAAAKHVADGTRNEVSNLSELQETLRRVTAIRDHVQNEQRRLVNVLRAKNYEYTPTGASDAVTVTSVLRTYDSELGKRTSAANTVRSAVTALENARNAIHTAMRDPGTFLGQVVDLRQYQKDQADAQVAEFGDDVPDSVSRTAMNAARALTNAQADLDAHNALVGDADNPASALLSALLEDETLPNGMANPADDDGQALIDAISSNYNTAKSAKDAADAAKAATDGLTGEDGKIADIEAKLMAKKEYIETLAGEIGINPMTGEGTADDMGHTRIDLNEARSMANATAIATNSENITANAGNIAMNAMHVMENRGMIESNTAAIGANAAMLMDHAGMISANASAISANSSTLSMHTQQISGLVDEMEVVRSGVAAGIAMASMPAVQGSGISVGVGSFDGESAFAVGYQYGGERVNFQIGVSSSGGETGAGAGVSFAIGQ